MRLLWRLCTLLGLVVLLLFLAGVFSVVFAATVPGNGALNSFPVSSAGNVSTVGSLKLDVYNFAKLSHEAGAIGDVVQRGKVSMPTPGGQSIPVDVVGRVPKAQVAAALGRFLGRALPLISTGMAIYQLGEELGYRFSNPSGTLETTHRETTAKEYNTCVHSGGSCTSNPWGSGDLASSCATWIGSTTGGGGVVTSASPNGSSSCLLMSEGYAPIGLSYAIGSRTVTLPAPIYVPASVSDFTNALEAKTDWTTDSKLPEALRDAVNAGESVDSTPEAVSGPSSSPGASSSTTNITTGATTTSTSTNHFTYGPTSVTTNITTNVTTTNSSGVVTESTTKDETPESEALPTDTGLPGLPVLYVQKYPDGPGGVWTTAKTAVMASSIGGLTVSLMPNITGSGTCPTMVLALDFGAGMNYGSHDVAPPCWVWAFGKLVIVISALLLARRLIFGG